MQGSTRRPARPSPVAADGVAVSDVDVPGAGGPPVAAGARLVFFGSGAFAVPALDLLLARDAAVVAVVSTPDRPAGRDGTPTRTPVAARARAAGIPLLQPASLRTADAAEALRACAPDAVVRGRGPRVAPLREPGRPVLYTPAP